MDAVGNVHQLLDVSPALPTAERLAPQDPQQLAPQRLTPQRMTQQLPLETTVLAGCSTAVA